MPRTRPCPAALVTAGVLLGSLWTGTATAPAASGPLSVPPGIVVSGQHWDDDDDDWDDEDDYHHRHWDDDLEDYPDCDRRGNGYGCPEYGYPPQR